MNAAKGRVAASQPRARMACTTFTSILEWFSALEDLARAGTCAAPQFIKPFHLATLAHALRRKGRLTDLQLPNKIAPYADTMQLWEALDVPSPFPEKNRQPAGRYHPIEVLRDESTIEATAQSLTSLFRTVCHDEQTNDAIYVMLRELLGNCYAHSDVTDGLYGLICAQVWSGGRRAQIVLSDSGIGIRKSLAQNALLSDRLKTENACSMATEYGVTSKPGKGHSGYGLAVARKLLEQNKGFLLVLSGTEALISRHGELSQMNMQTAWGGTLLVIEWDLDAPMDIGAVYAGFPLPEGMDENDFDF